MTLNRPLGTGLVDRGTPFVEAELVRFGVEA